LCRQFALHCLVLPLPVRSLLLECGLPCPCNVLVPVLVCYIGECVELSCVLSLSCIVLLPSLFLTPTPDSNSNNSPYLGSSNSPFFGLVKLLHPTPTPTTPPLWARQTPPFLGSSNSPFLGSSNSPFLGFWHQPILSFTAISRPLPPGLPPFSTPEPGQLHLEVPSS
jgi:hypothetical protein